VGYVDTSFVFTTASVLSGGGHVGHAGHVGNSFVLTTASVLSGGGHVGHAGHVGSSAVWIDWAPLTGAFPGVPRSPPKQRAAANANNVAAKTILFSKKLRIVVLVSSVRTVEYT
jgi:hypothetical protein